MSAYSSCRKAKIIIKGLELDPSRVGILELDEMGEEGAAIQVGRRSSCFWLGCWESMN